MVCEPACKKWCELVEAMREPVLKVREQVVGVNGPVSVACKLCDAGE